MGPGPTGRRQSPGQEQAALVQDAWSLSRGGDDTGPASSSLLDSLAARAAAGDKAAFERIYHLLADDLYAFVRVQCHDETVAEDLVANTFLKAWRSAKRYRPGSEHFRQWIFAIARNEVRDHWRTSRSTVPISELDLEGPDPGGIQDGERLAARAVVAQALDVLTEEQRQVVVLRYFNNKSHAEIAAIMGKREGAVRALLLRAMRHMRKVMADAAP